jgi:hypothetical protein
MAWCEFHRRGPPKGQWIESEILPQKLPEWKRHLPFPQVKKQGRGVAAPPLNLEILPQVEESEYFS